MQRNKKTKKVYMQKKSKEVDDVGLQCDVRLSVCLSHAGSASN